MALKVAFAVLLFGAGGCAPSEQPPLPSVRFVDVVAQAGLTATNRSGNRKKSYIIEAKGGGTGLFDCDGDSDLDAYLINGSSFAGFRSGHNPYNRLYRNRGNGTFEDISLQAGVGDTSWSMGCAAADIDNDGDLDLYVTNYGPNRLFRNRGDCTFDDITAVAGVGDERWGAGAAFGDYDIDGDLDLYLANYLQFDPAVAPDIGSRMRWKDLDVFPGPESYAGEADVLYRNDGGGIFTDVTGKSLAVASFKGFQPVFVDVDDDGYPDIYVTDDTTPNLLFHNRGDGTFEDVSFTSGASHSEDGGAQSGMGTAVGDYDNDGDLDLYVTNFSDDYNTLYRNEGGYFTDLSFAAGVAEPSMPFVGWGTAFFDFDNDGDLDLYVANGHVYAAVDDFDLGTSYAQRDLLFENIGNGRFEEIGQLVGLTAEKVSRGAAFGDIDNDGDVDVLVLNVDDTPSLLRNDGGNRRNWLTVSTEGTVSNRDGIGARVEVTSGSRRQIREVRSGSSFLSHSDLRLHFGLDTATEVELLTIRWPSGVTQEFRHIEANQSIRITEGEAGLKASPSR